MILKNTIQAIVLLALITASGSLVSKNQTAQAAGNTYYVAANGGSDSRSCATATNENTPRQTINAGIACLTAGDTLLLRGGTYNETIDDSNSPGLAGTSWTNKIRIASYPGETARLEPQTNVGGGHVIRLSYGQTYIEFEGLIIDGSHQENSVATVEWAANAPQAHHIRFIKNEFYGNTSVINGQYPYGVVFQTAIGNATGGNELINNKIHHIGVSDLEHCIYIQTPDNLVQANDIYDCAGAGLQIFDFYGFPPSGNKIIGNKIHDTRLNAGPGSYGRHWGILVAGADNNTVINNVIWNIPTETSDSICILLYTGTNLKIYNNTCYNAGLWGIRIDGGVSNAVVQNNIVYGSTYMDYQNSGSNTTACSSCNLFGINPQFYNISNNDFHLTAASPARDAGLTISQASPDFDNVVRTAPYDIGAYEFGGVVTPPPPPGPTPPPPPAVSFSASPASVAVGSSVNLTWANIPNPSTLDWLALFHPGDTSETDWLNVSCVQAPASAPIPSGSCSFPIKTTITPGAYEFRLLANNSYTVLATSQPITIALRGDLDYNHIVNSLDWSYMNSKWFGTDATADIDHNGIVNSLDFSIMNSNWFKTW